jgi:hypothetical protein
METKSSKGKKNGMMVAVVPWLVFTVLANHANLKLAAVASLVLAGAIALPGIRAGKAKILDLGAVSTFVGFVVVAFTVDASVAHDVTLYARGIAAGALALIAFASLLFTPFTEQYARESVPLEYWGSAQFKAVNRRLTTMWGLIFAAMIPGHILAGAIDRPAVNVVLNFVVPGMMVMWGIKRSGGAGEGKVAVSGRAAV